jgi:hypothetical protein
LVATLRLTESGGRCTSIGQVAAEAALPLFELSSRDVHLHIGPGMARPAIPAIPDLVAAGRLQPQHDSVSHSARRSCPAAPGPGESMGPRPTSGDQLASVAPDRCPITPARR